MLTKNWCFLFSCFIGHTWAWIFLIRKKERYTHVSMLFFFFCRLIWNKYTKIQHICVIPSRALNIQLLFSCERVKGCSENKNNIFLLFLKLDGIPEKFHERLSRGKFLCYVFNVLCESVYYTCVMGGMGYE